MVIFKEISKINIIVFLAIILTPLYLFKKSIFNSTFNFSLYLITTSIIVFYYSLIIFFVKSKILKYMAYFCITLLFFIQFIFLYSFVLNKNYTWKELNAENLIRPLIIWLEEERDRLILARQTQEVILDNQISNDGILEDEEIDSAETEEEETYNRRKYLYEDEYESYQSDDSGYHYVEGYTRDDGTEVEGYVRGDPDGIEENNIEYMRDNGDQDGLNAAFSSVFN
ncbi:hypothetical protein [Acinetobacter pittii]|uniref:hypothetical protein n=1 Tax=Acinetobacter pittii TaxID=48296 RepID=UPI001F28FA79|nr:hypothetical protein [Acinetobacter pittii]MCE6238516.1 hypothetical protein [Acinetobacter pittii]MCE6693268.1 hypothetical protein [Acinetobacter pittii]MCE6700722.1 hypothetical protein [Acinetobacter pittii]WLE90676.1 hypothetical protein PNCAADPE_00001 [Acinetobacter pittii]